MSGATTLALRINSYACFTLNPSPLSYFNMMRVSSTLSEGNTIECPAIRCLNYVIGNTLQAHGDFTRPNEEDMMILTKVVFPNINIRPNLGTLPIIYLNHQLLEAHDPICGGGAITILASALNINVSSLRALEGPRRLVFTTLNACGMFRKING
jgi:hypothetical protein